MDAVTRWGLARSTLCLPPSCFLTRLVRWAGSVSFVYPLVSLRACRAEMVWSAPPLTFRLSLVLRAPRGVLLLRALRMLRPHAFSCAPSALTCCFTLLLGWMLSRDGLARSAPSLAILIKNKMGTRFTGIRPYLKLYQIIFSYLKLS